MIPPRGVGTKDPHVCLWGTEMAVSNLEKKRVMEAVYHQTVASQLVGVTRLDRTVCTKGTENPVQARGIFGNSIASQWRY